MSEFAISRLDTGNGLKVVGELDVATVSQLTEALRRVSSWGDVVLDFSELTFLDSCGIRALLEFAQARHNDGRVVILDPSDAASRVLEIVGIDQHPGMELTTRAELPVG